MFWSDEEATYKVAWTGFWLFLIVLATNVTSCQREKTEMEVEAIRAQKAPCVQTTVEYVEEENASREQ